MTFNSNIGMFLLASLPAASDPDVDEILAFSAATSSMGDSFSSLMKSLWPQDKELSIQEQIKFESDVLANVAALQTGPIPEPTSYRKAIAESHPERDKWITAINKEVDNLVARGTWEVIRRT